MYIYKKSQPFFHCSQHQHWIIKPPKASRRNWALKKKTVERERMVHSLTLTWTLLFTFILIYNPQWKADNEWVSVSNVPALPSFICPYLTRHDLSLNVYFAPITFVHHVTTTRKWKNKCRCLTHHKSTILWVMLLYYGFTICYDNCLHRDVNQ